MILSFPATVPIEAGVTSQLNGDVLYDIVIYKAPTLRWRNSGMTFGITLVNGQPLDQIAIISLHAPDI